MMKVDPGLHHRLRYTFSMSGKVRNLREPASQALFCYALLSQTNDVERWWNDDENEPLCLVPLYILSIMGKPRTTSETILERVCGQSLITLFTQYPVP